MDANLDIIKFVLERDSSVSDALKEIHKTQIELRISQHGIKAHLEKISEQLDKIIELIRKDQQGQEDKMAIVHATESIKANTEKLKRSIPHIPEGL